MIFFVQNFINRLKLAYQHNKYQFSRMEQYVYLDFFYSDKLYIYCPLKNKTDSKFSRQHLQYID